MKYLSYRSRGYWEILIAIWFTFHVLLPLLWKVLPVFWYSYIVEQMQIIHTKKTALRAKQIDPLSSIKCSHVSFLQCMKRFLLTWNYFIFVVVSLGSVPLFFLLYCLFWSITNIFFTEDCSYITCLIFLPFHKTHNISTCSFRDFSSLFIWNDISFFFNSRFIFIFLSSESYCLVIRNKTFRMLYTSFLLTCTKNKLRNLSYASDIQQWKWPQYNPYVFVLKHFIIQWIDR